LPRLEELDFESESVERERCPKTLSAEGSKRSTKTPRRDKDSDRDRAEEREWRIEDGGSRRTRIRRK
jgi:hypothetical protein